MFMPWFDTLGVTNLFSYCHEISCIMGEVESVGTVRLVCVGRLLRMGCDPFLISVCGSVGVGKTLWKQNGLP